MLGFSDLDVLSLSIGALRQSIEDAEEAAGERRQRLCESLETARRRMRRDDGVSVTSLLDDVEAQCARIQAVYADEQRPERRMRVCVAAGHVLSEIALLRERQPGRARFRKF